MNNSASYEIISLNYSKNSPTHAHSSLFRRCKRLVSFYFVPFCRVKFKLPKGKKALKSRPVIGVMATTAEVCQVMVVAVSLSLERDVTVSLVHVYFPTIAQSLLHDVEHPLRQIEYEKRQVEPLQLLMAVYKLMVQHIFIHPSLVPCEYEAKKRYSSDVSLWHEPCLYYFSLQFHFMLHFSLHVHKGKYLSANKANSKRNIA